MKIRIVMGVLALGFGISAKAESRMSIVAGTADFFALGKPSMLKIHGVDGKIQGTLNLSKDTLGGSIHLKPADFETGMKLRDQHLRDRVFETAKFEEASFTFDQLKLPSPEQASIKDLPFKGILSLHGVRKEVEGRVDLNRDSKTLSFKASMEVKLTDYAITPPEFMGMKIEDQVKILVQGEAK